MTTTLESLTVTVEMTPLDLLLWRHYRREAPGLVEDTFARNPGLASMGVYLPVGTTVLVAPPAPASRRRAADELVSLYD